MGGKNGEEVAIALGRFLPKGECPQTLISVVACYSTAVSHYRNPNNFLHRVKDNFAANLHRALKTKCGIKVRVSGRGTCLWVKEDENGKVRKVTGPATFDTTRQVYVPQGEPQHKYKGDKIIYWWEGEDQKYDYA